VSDPAADASLAAEAEALAREVRRHASVLSRRANLPETAAAINPLRVAARRYVAAVMTATGCASAITRPPAACSKSGPRWPASP
jgi:hypothetical protein